MKPGFALSLSFEGIRLLRRAAGGWRTVGEVALDSADIGAALTDLREKAERLAPGEVYSKLLLPNEQIKYLTIDTPGMDDADRHAAAAAALDGATPYAVEDLAFDISAEGDKTHIAAVAHETLAEAEGFASEHNFRPVSFSAVPADQGYLGAPFFGLASGAADALAPGETVEPDGIAVVVIGSVEDEVPPEPIVEPLPEAAAPEVAAAPEPSEARPPELDETPLPAAEAEAPQAVGFASRRSRTSAKTPELGGVKRDAPPPNQAPPVAPQPEPVAALEAGTVTASQIAIEPDSSSLTAEAVPAAPAPPAPRSGFLSRRRSKEPTAAEVIAAPAPAGGVSEQERLTVFGARKSEIGGKPRFLGLILTAALLIFLAGVAAWASVFLDDGLKLSRLFGERAPELTFSDAAEELPLPEPAPVQPEIITASLSPTLTEEDAAVLDALREPVEPQPPAELTEEQLAAQYAATGIWPRAPEVPPEPADLISLEDLYVTSIDPVSTAADAIALPPVDALNTDVTLALVTSPAAAGTQFALDDNGLVIPTAQGALSPDGFTVFLGRPPIVPPATPTRFQSEPQDTAVRSALAAIRPQPRPADLVENTERAQLDGLTRSELAGFRPVVRPQSLQEQAEAAAAAVEPIATDGAVALALAPSPDLDNATRLAIAASLRPDTRPSNFARIVQRAQRNATPAEEEVRVASAAAVAPRTVTPNIPSTASVSRQATVRNAINLRKINLIGVYGKPSNRRALVRLDNGRYKKVVVGDRLDGGRVSAIGDSELRYTKRGRDLVLRMPR